MADNTALRSNILTALNEWTLLDAVFTLLFRRRRWSATVFNPYGQNNL